MSAAQLQFQVDSRIAMLSNQEYRSTGACAEGTGRQRLQCRYRSVGDGYGSGDGTDKAAIKLPWLALRNVLAKRSRCVHTWKAAINQFAILFGERLTEARD